MKKLPILIFLFIMASAFCTSMCSFRSASDRIEADVNNALELTLAEMQCDVVSADTIRCYRNYLTIAELKDTACIAMRTVRRGERQETEIVAEANCNFMTVFMLSDQRASGVLLFAGILWIMGSLWYMRRFKPEVLVEGLRYGGLIYTNEKFMTAKGEQIRLTPMQHTLLEMFMNSENHCLSKQEICDRLWPKKPDASDTLYTLIKRMKPIIEEHSNLKIESDRGKSYTLKLK
ncbi:MAG: winged helix-turn-helix domain-containing protein [Prevotella sp.]|nr:winged helix-turn-helix domain-containing protein [Prevotella sp.]MBR2035518.1 winged helix-turn-helix domain-containing protein [Prevotella sp.]